MLIVLEEDEIKEAIIKYLVDNKLVLSDKFDKIEWTDRNGNFVSIDCAGIFGVELNEEEL